jgi:hypothetical protein
LIHPGALPHVDPNSPFDGLFADGLVVRDRAGRYSERISD